MTDASMVYVIRTRQFLGKARDGLVKRRNITQKEALKIIDAAINLLNMAKDEESKGNETGNDRVAGCERV